MFGLAIKLELLFPFSPRSQIVFENANQQYKAAHKRKNIDRWTKQGTISLNLPTFLAQQFLYRSLFP
jgi:hypothetical protein